MIITSTEDAGALVKTIREERGLSCKMLSELSGVPLRTVYAIEGVESHNLSIDRLCKLLSAMGARLDVQVDGAKLPDSSTNDIVDNVARGTAGDKDLWGIWNEWNGT